MVFHDIPLDRGTSPVCRRCEPGAAFSPEYRDAADVEAEIAATAGPGAGVLLSGAAPLGHPGFDGLLEKVRSSGAGRIGVRTTGEPLADPSKAARLIAEGVRLFEIPFLGSHAQLHDPLSGVPGSHDAAVRAVGTLRAAAEGAGVRIAVRALLGVCRHTAPDLPAAVMHLAQLEVTSVILVCGDSAEAKRYAEWIGAACDTGTVNRVWVSVSGLPAELLGDRALHATDVLTLERAGR